MGVKSHVFASNAERRIWNNLQRQWGEKYFLHPNLPYLRVFDTTNLIDISTWPDALPPPKVSMQEFAWLKKESIDFTLCNAVGKPLVCIEYDGMQEGYNVGTQYKAADPTDPWRDKMMALKLKVAHGSLFPYFMVGTRHLSEISHSVQMCLMDGVIGSVLAKQSLQERTGNFKPEQLGMTSKAFETLSIDDQNQLIQNWFIGVEVEEDFGHNPVFSAEYELWKSLVKRLGAVRHSTRFIYLPDAYKAKTPTERAELMQRASLIGAECTVTTQQFGEIARDVWVPNFRTPGYSPYGFLPELASLVALDAVRKLADSAFQRY